MKTELFVIVDKGSDANGEKIKRLTLDEYLNSLSAKAMYFELKELKSNTERQARLNSF